ncbi:MAG: hypothetical protein JW798_03875, partial [Prolixibacteraceae bacterium]|nr:hypothetical protein [Prolixibacteraceae bacterium]
MKAIITITIIATFIFTFIKPAQSQLRVENDGSVYVNSYTGSWGRAMWTKIHTSNACAYHLWNTNYEDQNGENGDVFCVLGNGAVWTINGYLQVSDSAFKT